MKDQNKKSPQDNQEFKDLANDTNDNDSQPTIIEEIDYKDKYVRLLAEYTNFSKQKEEEIKSVSKYANKNLLTKIIDIVDDIDNGLMQEQISEETKAILNILKIKTLQILAMEGVLEIELNSGDEFDAEKCEVIQTIEDKDFDGKIVQVLRKGYTISDRILRTAKVIVGK